MGRAKDALARKLYPHEVRVKDLSPRLKLAIRLYSTGLAKTMREASEKAGLNPSVFYITKSTEPKVSELMAYVDRQLEQEELDTAALIKRLGRQAVRNIAHLMENAKKEEVQLKAAQDLADRSPETSKVINVNARVETPLTEDAVASLRRSILEAAALRERFVEAAEGNYVTVSDASTARSLDLVKERAPRSLPSGE